MKSVSPRIKWAAFVKEDLRTLLYLLMKTLRSLSKFVWWKHLKRVDIEKVKVEYFRLRGMSKGNCTERKPNILTVWVCEETRRHGHFHTGRGQKTSYNTGIFIGRSSPVSSLPLSIFPASSSSEPLPSCNPQSKLSSACPSTYVGCCLHPFPGAQCKCPAQRRPGL